MFVRAEIPYVHIVHPVSAFAELAAKFALNAISTYAHVCIGKVYKNRMVDLAVSNTKLFHRSIAIVGELMAVSEVSIDSVLPSHSRDSLHTEAVLCAHCRFLLQAEATTCILRSIYEVDEVSSDLAQRPISRHIEAAARRRKVVPLALLLVRAKRCSPL